MLEGGLGVICGLQALDTARLAARFTQPGMAPMYTKKSRRGNAQGPVAFCFPCPQVEPPSGGAI
jgi:hypothetical protein